MRCAAASVDASIADKSRGLVLPFPVQEIERVQQRRRRAIIVFRRDEYECVRGIHAFAPPLRVVPGVLPTDWVLRLVDQRQIEIREVDEARIEAAMFLRKLMEPFGRRCSDAGGPGAGDDGVKPGCHGIASLWALVTGRNPHYICAWPHTWWAAGKRARRHIDDTR